MKAKRFNWAEPVKWLAWLSLVAAFVFGQIAAKPEHQALLADKLPQLSFAAGEQITNRGPTLYWITDNAADPSRAADILRRAEQVLVATGDGFAGPLTVAIGLRDSDKGPRITGISLLDNVETPPYLERLEKRMFFRQFTNKPLTNDFLLDSDIDGYSGATVTARAVSQAVGDAVHTYATEGLGMEPSWQLAPWQFGVNEGVMLVLMVAAIYISSRLAKRNKFTAAIKTLLPLGALAFVGFYVNASVSIGSLASIVMGYVPAPKQYPLWWIMMGGIGIGILVMGKNVYCQKLCAFHTVQTLLTKISGLNFKLDPKLARKSRTVILTLIWGSLMLIFLSRYPALGSYEPFSMMFALKGMGLQWYILPLSLIGSFFVADFWCRYFCPVGLTLNEAVRARRKALNTVGGLVSRSKVQAQPIQVQPATARSERNG